MKQRCLFMVLAIVGALFASAYVSAAETGLPYVGTRAVPCNVNPPVGQIQNIDGGYRTDESCQTIFVLPPDMGRLVVSAPGYMNTKACPLIKGVWTYLDKLYSEPVSIRGAVKRFNEIRDLLQAEKRVGQNEVFSEFQIALSLNWDSLLEAYKKANPKMSVIRVPIVSGLLSASIKNKKNYTLSGDPVLSIKMEGVQSSQPTGDHDPFVTKVLAGLQTAKTFAWDGSGTTGLMRLTLPGTCGLFDHTSSGGPQALFAATYTYFYPVQSKSSYTVNISARKFANEVAPIIIANNGKITSAELENAIKNAPSITVTMNNGLNGNNSALTLKSDFESQIKNISANMLLSLVADKINYDVNSERYNTYQTHSYRVCHGWWFFSHCETRTYIVPIHHVAWDQAIQKVKEILNGNEPGVEQYQTHYFFGTSGFAAIKNNGKEADHEAM